MRRLLGIVLVLAGVALALVGTATAVVVGPDDTLDVTEAQLATDTAAVVSSPDLLHYGGVTVHVTVTSESTDTFVGAAHPVHLTSYLDDVAHDRLTTLDRDGETTLEAVDGAQTSPAVAPDGLDWWQSADHGAGERTIAVDLRGDPVGVIVMNTDLSAPVEVDVAVSAEVNGVFVVAVLVAVLGLALVVGVVLLTRRRSRRRRRRPPRFAKPRPGRDDPPPEDDRPGAAYRAAGAAGIAALALSGCATVPRAVEHTDPPAVVATTPEDAETILGHVTEATNAAHAAADPKQLAEVAGGQLLATSTFAYESQQAQGSEPTPEVAISPGEIAAPELTEYPLWFLTTDDGDTEDALRTRYLFSRSAATSPWRAALSVELPADVDVPAPTLTDGTATVSSEDTTKEGRAVLDALVGYAESGTEPDGVDLAAAGDLTGLSAQGYTVTDDSPDVGTETRSCELAVPDDIHWMDTADGAVTTAAISCTQTLKLAAGYWFTTPEPFGTIPAGVDLVGSTITQSVSFVLEVRDDGTSRVVGERMRPTSMAHTLR